jgi:hypothetical protein
MRIAIIIEGAGPMNQPSTRLALLGFALMLALAACAPGPNELARSAGSTGGVAGFWLGLWHGLIAPVTFVISLFSKGVQMYEVHNNGAWYNFGFLFGACVSLGGSGAGGARRSNRTGRPPGRAG